MDADNFRVGVFHSDEDIGPAFLDGDGLRHVCSPHFIDLVGDDCPIVRLSLRASDAMRREQAVLAHHPSYPARACANARKAQARPYLAVALAVQAGGGYLLPDMVCQFGIRTCPERTRATGSRFRGRLFERAIDAGARELPHARYPRQTITTSQARRECLAHRRDLLWAKGRLPSSAAILA